MEYRYLGDSCAETRAEQALGQALRGVPTGKYLPVLEREPNRVDRFAERP